jgi:hypothetical protein
VYAIADITENSSLGMNYGHQRKIDHDRTTGRIWVAYLRKVPNQDDYYVNTVWVAYSDDSGSTWTAENISHYYDYDEDSDVTLCVDAAGRVHVAWTRSNTTSGNDEVRYRRFQSDNWQPIEILSDPNYDACAHCIVVGAGSDVDLVYESKGYGVYSTYAQLCHRRWTEGTGWGAQTVVTDHPMGIAYASAVADDSGGLHVAYDGRFAPYTSVMNVRYAYRSPAPDHRRDERPGGGAHREGRAGAHRAAQRRRGAGVKARRMNGGN